MPRAREIDSPAAFLHASNGRATCLFILLRGGQAKSVGLKNNKPCRKYGLNVLYVMLRRPGKFRKNSPVFLEVSRSRVHEILAIGARSGLRTRPRNPYMPTVGVLHPDRRVFYMNGAAWTESGRHACAIRGYASNGRSGHAGPASRLTAWMQGQYAQVRARQCANDRYITSYWIF